jgi:signal peptidase I
VLEDPTDHGLAIKRVIAQPGDSLRLKDSTLYLNSIELSEPHLPEGLTTLTLDGPSDQLVVFGDDRCFVLGDNRDNSLDSLYYGTLWKKSILGTVAE